MAEVYNLDRHRKDERANLTPDEIKEAKHLLTSLVNITLRGRVEEPLINAMIESVERIFRDPELDSREKIVLAVASLRDDSEAFKEDGEKQKRFYETMQNCVEMLNGKEVKQFSPDRYMEYIRNSLKNMNDYIMREDGHSGATRKRREWNES